MSWSKPKTNWGKGLQQPWLGGGIGAILAVFFGLLFLYFNNLIPNLLNWSYDLPFLARREKPINDVAMVYLKEEDFRDLKQDPDNFDRALYAKLIRVLKEQGAKMVVFDILFIDPKPNAAEADRDLAAAIKEFGNVVLSGKYSLDKSLAKPTEQIVPPLEEFRDAGATWGLALIDGSDLEPRQIQPGSDRVPTFDWKAAQLAGAEVTKNPDNRSKTRWLNYYSRKPFVDITFSDAIGGLPLHPGFSFKDKVVFVGQGSVAGAAEASKDEFRSPWSSLHNHFFMPGVDLHGITYSNLVRQDWLRRLPLGTEMLVMIVSGVLLGFGLCRFKPWRATAVSLGIVVGISLVVYVLLEWGRLWFPWLIIVLIQLPLALGWAYLYNAVKSYVDTQVLEASLGFYLSPDAVKEILRRPDLLAPGAKEQTVSILFSDIANFSKISERMSPQDLVELLNKYYEATVGCVRQTEGTILDLIGDAMLAMWNAPIEQPDHQERACRAALLLDAQLVAFDANNPGLPMRTRIGLHTGVASVGNIGSSTHFDYAALGQNVNMASRLEGLNKMLGTNILATREIQKTVEKEIVTRQVGHFRFKGSDRVVEVYELIAMSADAENSKPWRETFAKALWHFRRGALVEAEEGFRATLKLRPDDGPAQFYIEKTAEMRASELPAEWMGEIDLREK